MVQLRALALVGFIVSCSSITTYRTMDFAKQDSYDDNCELQKYFDQRVQADLAPIESVSEASRIEKGVTMGHGVYQVHDPFARRQFALLLEREFSGVERRFIDAVDRGDGAVTVAAEWWESANVKRLHPTLQMTVDTPAGPVQLPPNSCVSDFLFGQNLYTQRTRYNNTQVAILTDSLPSSLPSASASSSQTAP
jgi:hypothetical protein